MARTLWSVLAIVAIFGGCAAPSDTGGATDPAADDGIHGESFDTGEDGTVADEDFDAGDTETLGVGDEPPGDREADSK